MSDTYVQNENDLIPGRVFYIEINIPIINGSVKKEKELGFYKKKIKQKGGSWGIFISSEGYLFSKNQNDDTNNIEFFDSFEEKWEKKFEFFNSEEIVVDGQFYVVPTSDLKKIYYKADRGGRRRLRKTKRRKSKHTYKKKSFKKRRY